MIALKKMDLRNPRPMVPIQKKKMIDPPFHAIYIYIRTRKTNMKQY